MLANPQYGNLNFKRKQDRRNTSKNKSHFHRHTVNNLLYHLRSNVLSSCACSIEAADTKPGMKSWRNYAKWTRQNTNRPLLSVLCDLFLVNIELKSQSDCIIHTRSKLKLGSAHPYAYSVGIQYNITSIYIIQAEVRWENHQFGLYSQFKPHWGIKR